MARGGGKRTYVRDSRGRFASTPGGRAQAKGGTLGARSSLKKSRAKLASKNSADRSLKNTLSTKAQKGAVTRGKKALQQSRKAAQVGLKVSRPKGAILRKPKAKDNKKAASPLTKPLTVRQAQKRISLPAAGVAPMAKVKKPKGYKVGDISRKIKATEAKKAAARIPRVAAVSASYTKLRSGDWGVRIRGKAEKGQTIEVVTKAGARKSEALDRKLWSGDGVSIWTLRPRQQPQQSYTQGPRNRFEPTKDRNSLKRVEAYYRRLGWDGVRGSRSYYSSGLYDEMED